MSKEKIPAAAKKGAFVKERTSFKSLQLINPNYFGNLAGSELKVVQPIQFNTYYEQLMCVGYQPQQEQLEAVVHVKQPSGYGTGICGNGTTEYVRFYLSFDGGATWKDQGVTGFRVFNVPEGTAGGKDLEYAASLKVDPPSKWCVMDPLIKMRAILSWETEPTANDPDYIPVWGNRLDADILVEPFRFVFPGDIFELPELKVPPFLKEVLDPEIPIQLKKKELSLPELSTLYKDKKVPVHRFAFKELKAGLLPQISPVTKAKSLEQFLPGMKIDPDIFKWITPTDGNTDFEELTCIGLDPNLPDTLVGIVKVKLPNGYSGGPCTTGSKEYVTFHADFDGNGSFETCLGTTEVRVYDLAKLPKDGVSYAVRLPVDLSK
ncbi:MAG: hypothetical protein IPL49_21070 [Saprospirales bacterium]|nr:hypothetical protein [Saprospirales bacterium]